MHNGAAVFRSSLISSLLAVVYLVSRVISSIDECAQLPVLCDSNTSLVCFRLLPFATLVNTMFFAFQGAMPQWVCRSRPTQFRVTVIALVLTCLFLKTVCCARGRRDKIHSQVAVGGRRQRMWVDTLIIALTSAPASACPLPRESSAR